MTTVIDCAGARIGGAKRLLNELDLYLSGRTGQDVRLLGRDRGLSPHWLVRRELAAVGASRVIALNNVSFQAAGRSRVVLARNALQFLSPAEEAACGQLLPPRLRSQTRVARSALRRADRIVVPATSMRERIEAAVPE
nr:hypothetical protein [Micromonospora sp. DSM 115978]